MFLDGPFFRAKDFGDLEQIHVLDESKDKDSALPLRQLCGCGPYRSQLISHERSHFGRGMLRRKKVREVMHTGCAGSDSLPELESPTACQIAHEIRSDLH